MQTKKSLNLELINQKLFDLGINQAKISEKLGVSREAVSKWFKEENLPSANLLLKLSKLLKLTFKEILKIDYLNQPIIAYRKNATAKTTDSDIEFATNTGKLLENIIPYFQRKIITTPPVLLKPKVDYNFIADFVHELRNEMKIENDILKLNDIISIFYKYNSIIIPVIWIGNKRHANALRIYLQDSKTTFVYINLNVKLHDFKFWIAHELGHVISPELKGDDAEIFADKFAGALLFPENQVEALYNTLIKVDSDRYKIHLIIEKGKEFIISPLSVYLQLCAYSDYYNKQKIDLDQLIYKFNTKYHSYFPTVATKIFKTENPKAEDYIKYVNDNFKPSFFDCLGKYIQNKNLTPTFIQNLLDISFLDAKNIYHAL